jgi:hypothetical protein
MFPRDASPKPESGSVPESFTGFLATYDDGTTVLEREGYHSEKTRRLMATSWPEIDLDRLSVVDLYWHGTKKATVSKSEHPDMKPSDWFFSQTGYMDLMKHAVAVIGRNVGYRGEDGLLYVTTVNELDGAIKGSIRA